MEHRIGRDLFPHTPLQVGQFGVGLLGVGNTVGWCRFGMGLFPEGVDTGEWVLPPHFCHVNT